MPDVLPQELFHTWPSVSSRPCFVGKADGTILWVNDAFCRLVRYSSYELTKDNGGMNWFTDLGNGSPQIDADIHEAAECAKGMKASYAIRREFVPLHEDPIVVTQVVFRYPFDTEHDKESYLRVEIIPSSARDDIATRRYYAIEKTQLEILDSIRRINLYVRRLGLWFTIRRIIRAYRWSLNKYPARTVVVTLIVILCLLGYTEVSVSLIEQHLGIDLTSMKKVDNVDNK